ncbi:hypothetical protein SAMN05216296_2545 [Pseudomonas pohangensis]|jgi:hypothetical protein|uniref:Pilin assembly protein n=1 Tax=Pseudomonas pohangensis TaxID=364197 RepID=A0A1H2GUG3_9PSED|nr:pilin assembly protein [Pseudomonas pohangensis]SDU23223.1 hypothetical protein SAMN05216296_2545 [Pseudomonas pohangensis]
MKIRELAQHWQRNATDELSPTRYQLRLGLEAGARLEALAEMYPLRSAEELLGELVAAALEELAASLPYVKGSRIIATDEQGDPQYEDIGPTPRFLALTHKHMEALRQVGGK